MGDIDGISPFNYSKEHFPKGLMLSSCASVIIHGLSDGNSFQHSSLYTLLSNSAETLCFHSQRPLLFFSDRKTVNIFFFFELRYTGIGNENTQRPRSNKYYIFVSCSPVGLVVIVAYAAVYRDRSTLLIKFRGSGAKRKGWRAHTKCVVQHYGHAFVVFMRVKCL